MYDLSGIARHNTSCFYTIHCHDAYSTSPYCLTIILFCVVGFSNVYWRSLHSLTRENKFVCYRSFVYFILYVRWKIWILELTSRQLLYSLFQPLWTACGDTHHRIEMYFKTQKICLQHFRTLSYLGMSSFLLLSLNLQYSLLMYQYRDKAFSLIHVDVVKILECDHLDPVMLEQSPSQCSEQQRPAHIVFGLNLLQYHSGNQFSLFAKW